MATNEQAAAALEQLTDAVLLHDTPLDVTRRAYGALGGLQWEGIALRAPSQADIGRDAAFPVLVAFAQSSARERQVRPGETAIVVVTGIEPNDRWIVPLFPPQVLKIPELDMEPPQTPAPPIDDGSTRMTAVQRLDLKALYGIPWQAGQYAIRAINYDWLSNTARVTLLGPLAQVPPATPHRAATRGDTSAPTRLPNFFESKYSPPPPDSGITLRIPARPMPRGQQLPLFGSAKVAARAEVLRASVILVRANVQNPIVLDLEIPVFPEDRTHPDGPAQLFFAYDLNAVASAPLPPATYQVYMVAGAYTAGPYPLTIE